ncbi:hypothetical protein I0600191H4_04800 [Collinsella sp. i06-0019-1H4]
MTKHGAGEVTRGPNNAPLDPLSDQKGPSSHTLGPQNETHVPMFDSIQQSAWRVFDKRVQPQTQQDAFDRFQTYSDRTDSDLSE